MNINPMLLIEARRAAKLTQEQLADAAGVSRKTVGKAESEGQVNATTASALAHALGVTVQQLAGPMRDEFTPRERRLIQAWRELPELERGAVEVFIQGMRAGRELRER